MDLLLYRAHDSKGKYLKKGVCMEAGELLWILN